MIPHTLTDTTLTVLGADFVPRSIPRAHPAWDEIVQALNDDDRTKLYMLIDLPAAVVDFMQGAITIADRVLYFNGRPIDNNLTRRVLAFMEQGQAELAKPLTAFLEKVMENPSYRAVQGLYEWVERSGLPITEEGDILAWKIVKDDYTDVRTGTFDNSIGNVVEIARHEVDENPDQTCSHGLHFCSTHYLPNYGAFHDERRVVVVKLHPRDVVAFPRDYNTSKGRACRYEVIGEIPAEKAADFFPSRYVHEPCFTETNPVEPLCEEITLDRFYRTRDGQLVEITRFDEEEDDFPYMGYFHSDRDTLRSWACYGSFNLYDEHPLDLVELLPKDFDPEAVTPEAGARYKTHGGETVEIVEVNDTRAVGLLRGVRFEWKLDGSFASAGVFGQLPENDLVERLSDDQPTGGWLTRLFTRRA